jgi:isoleucyl-tRNA synthetase
MECVKKSILGTPIPLWASEDLKEIVCVGSVEELKELSGFKGDLWTFTGTRWITSPFQAGKERRTSPH